MTLKGKIVFVTGASAGIGAATALAFAAEGARLLLAARRVEKLAAVADEALRRGVQAVHAFSLDVRNRKAVELTIDGGASVIVQAGQPPVVAQEPPPPGTWRQA